MFSMTSTPRRPHQPPRRTRPSTHSRCTSRRIVDNDACYSRSVASVIALTSSARSHPLRRQPHGLVFPDHPRRPPPVPPGSLLTALARPARRFVDRYHRSSAPSSRIAAPRLQVRFLTGSCQARKKESRPHARRHQGDLRAHRPSHHSSGTAAQRHATCSSFLSFDDDVTGTEAVPALPRGCTRRGGVRSRPSC